MYQMSPFETGEVIEESGQFSAYLFSVIFGEIRREFQSNFLK